MRVLQVIASPRRRSRSTRLADGFVDALQADEVTRLDLWRTDLPDLGGNTVEGRYKLIHGEDVDDDVRVRWDEIQTVANHALAHDLWVITAPMWNFGIPYKLKHWIDCIIHPKMTFSNDAEGNVTPLATERTAILIGAGALDFDGPEQQAALDFQMRYLETILGFIGVGPIHSVRAAPTFGPDDAVQSAMDDAVNELADIAKKIRPGDAPG